MSRKKRLCQLVERRRECLRGFLTQYLNAMVAHNPKPLPLAANMRFTENTKTMPIGEGLWKSASGLRSYRQDFLDVREGQAASHVIVEENGNPVMLAVRLKIADKKITEIETMVTRSRTEGRDLQSRRASNAEGRNECCQYDLVAMHPQNTVRLMPLNNYPALRGTRFSIEDLDFLYTTGFISELGQFHGMHVPSPLEIADHIGRDTSRHQILREILILTKMNWNSARLGGLWPITLRFSRLVGNILKELPEDVEPLTNYKFYT